MSTLNHSVASQYTELSLEAYKANGGNPDGWEYVSDSDKLMGESDSGYFGAIYKREVTDESGQQKTEYAVAHRGTEIKDLGDIGADLAIGFDIVPEQFNEAYQFTDKAKEYLFEEHAVGVEKYEIHHTGHSLGGALAKLIGMATDSQVVWSFNAPGIEHLRNDLEDRVDELDQRPSGYSQFVGKDYTNQITEVNAVGDKVSDFGSPSGIVYEIDVTPSLWSNLTDFILDSNPYTKPINWAHDAYFEHKIDELHEALGGTVDTTESDTQYNNYVESLNNLPNTWEIDNSFLDLQINTDLTWDIHSNDPFAIGGYDWRAEMPDDVINGDGMENVAPSTIVTDGWRPGAEELADLSLFDGIDTSLDHLKLDEEIPNSNYLTDFESEFSKMSNYYLESPDVINIDPLILDLDGDGVELISYDDSSVVFDVDNDGHKENTGWVSGHDGILVEDLNHNGVIDDITETFSEYYTPDTQTYLQQLRSNMEKHLADSAQKQAQFERDRLELKESFDQAMDEAEQLKLEAETKRDQALTELEAAFQAEQEKFDQLRAQAELEKVEKMQAAKDLMAQNDSTQEEALTLAETTRNTQRQEAESTLDQAKTETDQIRAEAEQIKQHGLSQAESSLASAESTRNALLEDIAVLKETAQSAFDNALATQNAESKTIQSEAETVRDAALADIDQQLAEAKSVYDQKIAELKAEYDKKYTALDELEISIDLENPSQSVQDQLAEKVRMLEANQQLTTDYFNATQAASKEYWETNAQLTDQRMEATTTYFETVRNISVGHGDLVSNYLDQMSNYRTQEQAANDTYRDALKAYWDETGQINGQYWQTTGEADQQYRDAQSQYFEDTRTIDDTYWETVTATSEAQREELSTYFEQVKDINQAFWANSSESFDGSRNALQNYFSESSQINQDYWSKIEDQTKERSNLLTDYFDELQALQTDYFSEMRQGFQRANELVFEDGLDALRIKDSNNDGVFDAQDEDFGQVRVWKDVNEDGITDAGELHTLDELGVKSIDLNKEEADKERVDGNVILSRSHLITESGEIREVAAVDFSTNPIGYEWNEILDGAILTSEQEGASTYVVGTESGQTAQASHHQVKSIYGNVGDDVLIGDDQDNWLVGGNGSDTLQGGAGNDLLVMDHLDRQENIDAGEGRDIVRFESEEGITFNMTDANAEVVNGGAGDDVIIGGGDYNAFITGGQGHDILIGGTADDALAGESGNDLLDGHYGDDILRGHHGDDVLIGGKGNDFIDGGRDNDVLQGCDGKDILSGGLGSDEIDGGDLYDIAQYAGSYADYKVSKTDTGFSVLDLENGDIDTLLNIESIRFDDVSFDVSLDSNNTPLPVTDLLTVEDSSSPIEIRTEQLLSNDVDFDGDVLSITGVSNAVGGQVALDSNTIIFTPDPNYMGVMSFDYTIADIYGDSTILELRGTNQTAEMKTHVQILSGDNPTDPLYVDQWYLSEVNVKGVWDDYSGEGISIGVFEKGTLNYLHDDLDDNVSNAHKQDLIFDEVEQFSKHKTLVSGVIAGERNGLGTIGIAYDSELAGYSWDPTQDGLHHMRHVDVANNSWGVTTPFADDYENYNLSIQETLDDIADAAQYGRDGLGTAVVFAGGNDRAEGDNTNYHNYQNSRHVITVGSINQEGDLGKLVTATTPFSNPGSSILVSAPGSNIESISHLMENDNGSIFGNDSSVVQGTSFSAPIVSGVVALMLEANNKLGYRDIQKILAYSALQFDDGNTVWKENDATDWNGGGLHFSEDYGFGIIDAFLAVRLAETWQETNILANEESIVFESSPGTVILDNSEITDRIHVDQSIGIEHIEIKVDIKHGNIEDLQVILTSPDGTESILVNHPYANPNPDNNPDFLWDNMTRSSDFFIRDTRDIEFTLSTTNHWGENSLGDWEIKIIDSEGNDRTGQLDKWEIKFFGNQDTENDTYIFTSEFSGVTDPNRKQLNDSDGGFDLINVSAVLSDSIINLNAGETSTIAGNTLTIAENVLIEAVYSGDGNDILIGNEADNILYGGRGNNTLTGNDGADTFVIKASQGQTDTITDFNPLVANEKINLADFNITAFAELTMVQQGQDVVIQLGNDQTLLLNNVNLEALTEDHFIFKNDAQVIAGSSSDDVLVGSNQAYDTIDGLDGDDTLSGLDGNDRLDGGAGNDVLFGGDGNDTLAGGTGSDQFVISKDAHATDTITDFDISPIDNIEKIETILKIGPTEFNQIIGYLNENMGFKEAFAKLLEDNGIVSENDKALANDKIDLSSFEAIQSFKDLDLVQNGDHTDIHLPDGQKIVLENVSKDSLTGNNFILSHVYDEIESNSVAGGEQNDVFTVGFFDMFDDQELSGSSSHDYIQGGRKHDVLYGLEGNDILNGSKGNDQLFGGEGHDILLGGSEGHRLLVGGKGSDKFLIFSSFRSGSDTIADFDINDPNEKIDLSAFGNLDTLTLKAYKNSTFITNLGSSGYVIILKGISPDQLQLDHFLGVNEDTQLIRTTTSYSPYPYDYPAHYVDGETLIGGSDDDTFYGNLSNDIIIGLDGDDILSGNKGNDILDGGLGDDRLDGGAGEDVLKGGSGNDTLDAGSGDDILVGGDGSDIFFLRPGSEEHDIIRDFDTSSSEEILDITEFVDVKTIDDIQINQENNDAILTINTSKSDVLEHYSINHLGDFYQVLYDNEAQGKSVLSLSQENNIVLVTFTDQETLVLENSTIESLIGESGIDSLERTTYQEGNTLLSMTQNGGHIEFTFTNGYYITLENVDGQTLSNNDFKFYQYEYYGSDNADYLYAGKGNDIVEGYEGDDYLSGNLGNDTIDGGSGNDRLMGDSGNDHLFGQSGHDQLFGGSGDDSLDGGEGNDVLYGGEGSDILTGGTGEDSFVFQGSPYSYYGDDSNTTTIITDFDVTSSEEKLIFEFIEDINGKDDLSIVQQETNTVITYENSTIVLENTQADLLTLDHFNFKIKIDNSLTNDRVISFDSADIPEINYKMFYSTDGRGSFSIQNEGITSQYLNGEWSSIAEGFNPAIDKLQISGYDANEFSDLILTQEGENTTIQFGENGRILTLLGVTKEIITSDHFVFAKISDDNDNMIYGRDGDDFIEAGNGDDTLIGGEGLDILFGEKGSDLLEGGYGNDRLYGGEGNDTFQGGSGNDILYLGEDNDVASGGYGNDIFYIYNQAESITTITDFELYADVIDLQQFETITNFDDLTIEYGEDENGWGFTTIHLNETTSIQLLNLSPDELTENHFHFAEVGTQYADVFIDKETDDLVNGGAGNDFIYAGIGYDKVTGGSGDDTFIINKNANTSTQIRDFDIQNEQIHLATFDHIDSFTDLTIEYKAISEGLYTAHISLGDYQTIEVQNLQDQSLNESHFIFENTAPIVEDDVFDGLEDTQIVLNLLLNDTDDKEVLNHHHLNYTNPQHGTVEVTENGKLIYTPHENFNGLDSITYTLEDSDGLISDTATISINIEAVNDAPILQDIYTSLDEDQDVFIDALNSSIDPDGDILSIESVATAENGLVEIVDNQIKYTPYDNFYGEDVFTYTVSDGEASVTQTIYISVDPVNDGPTGISKTIEIDEDQSTLIDVLVDATDIDGDSLTIDSFSQASNGTVAIEDGKIRYTGNQNYVGTDTFTYTISDENGGLDTQEITITLLPINDLPELNEVSVTTDEDHAILTDVLLGSHDPDGDTLIIESVESAGNGLVEIVGDQVKYTPNDNFYGQDSFDYSVSDGQGGKVKKTASVTVKSINDIPVATLEKTLAVEDQSILIAVLAGASDIDGDQLVIDSISQPLHGRAEIKEGKIQYQANENYFGEDVLTYTLSDGNGGLVTKELTINVDPVNDPIIVENSIKSFVLKIGQTVDYAIDQNTFKDVEGDAAYTAQLSDGSALPDWLIFDPLTKTFSGTPDENSSGQVLDIKVTATDAVSSASTEFHLAIANVFGTEAPDTIQGKETDDIISGGGGDDELSGGTGSDVLLGEDGDDSLEFGGDNTWTNEYYTVNADTGDMLAVVGLSRSYDIFDGGSGKDILKLTDLNDAYFLDDVYSPTQVNNGSRLADVEVIEAGNGHDVIDLSSFQFTYGDVEIYGGTGNDVLWSNKGNDKLYGEDGNDNLQGGKGADVLFGGSGEDILKGYTGNDQLNGGEGKDSLFGGSGNDLFVFSHLTDSNSENMDEILDFTQNEDQIDVSQLEVTDISDFHFSFDGINTVVNAVDSDFAFQLEGQFELNNNDFIFG